MMQTGVATLDDLLGGALPGRIHLLTGGPGSGKTSACLHFLRAGLQRSERAALVTLDRPRDLQSHAKLLGYDVRASVRDGRLTILRYDKRFTPRIAAAASPSAVVSELQQLLSLAALRQLAGPDAPLRIVIDPISPFISEGIGTGAALAALVDSLEEMNATVMLTWNGECSIAADRRVEPLIERAAVIVRLERAGSDGGTFRAEIIRARHAIANSRSFELEIRPGIGLSSIAPSEHRHDLVAPTPTILLGSLSPLDDRTFAESDNSQPPS